jgi:uncharacterized delta-60 repeat protein
VRQIPTGFTAKLAAIFLALSGMAATFVLGLSSAVAATSDLEARRVYMLLALAVQPDRKVVASGIAPGCRGGQLDFFSGGGTPSMLLRFTADGHLDQTFGRGGVVAINRGPQNFDAAFAMGDDGRFWIQGDPSAQGVQLLRYGADGKPDPTFKPQVLFPGSNISVSRFVSLPGGRTLLFLVTSDRATILRIDAGGSLDPTFGAGGVARGPEPAANDTGGVFPLPGKVLADGSILQPVLVYGTSAETTTLLRFTADGVLDPAFGDHGSVVFPSSVLGILDVTEGGRIMAMTNDPVDGRSFALARLSPAGAIDPAFGTRGYAMLPNPVPSDFSMLIFDGIARPDGKMLILAAAQLMNNPSGSKSVPYLARFGADGQLDHTFSRTGMIARNLTADREEMPSALAVDGDGKILMASRLMGCSSAVPFLLTRSLPDGSLDPAFGERGIAVP